MLSHMGKFLLLLLLLLLLQCTPPLPQAQILAQRSISQSPSLIRPLDPNPSLKAQIPSPKPKFKAQGPNLSLNLQIPILRLKSQF